SNGRAPAASGGPVSSRCDPGGDRSTVGCKPSGRVRVAQGMATGWSSFVALGGPCGTTRQAEVSATGQGGKGARDGRRGQWLRRRRMDLAARGRGDRAAD